MTKTMVAAAMFALALAACAEDSGEALPGDAQSDAPDAPACAELIGIPTQRVLDVESCFDDTGTLQMLATAYHDCLRGRLYWNDFGWGWDSMLWRAHARTDGQLVPPQPELDACGYNQ